MKYAACNHTVSLNKLNKKITLEGPRALLLDSDCILQQREGTHAWRSQRSVLQRPIGACVELANAHNS